MIQKIFFLPEKNVANDNDLLVGEDLLEVSESEFEYESELSSSDSDNNESVDESDIQNFVFVLFIDFSLFCFYSHFKIIRLDPRHP